MRLMMMFASLSVILAVPTHAVHAAEAPWVDFAAWEHAHPMTNAEAQTITPATLKTMSQEDLDRLYARLRSGPFPTGFLDGTVLMQDDAANGKTLKEFLNAYDLPVDYAVLERVVEQLWKGKRFDLERNVVTNRINISPIPLPATRFFAFPAKLYCGQSLLDARRESIVIDYLNTHTIAGYNPAIDWLAGAQGLRIRDEIRMIRPGLYLGRAYIDRVFALNFVLENRAGNNPPATDRCWTGPQ